MEEREITNEEYESEVEIAPEESPAAPEADTEESLDERAEEEPAQQDSTDGQPDYAEIEKADLFQLKSEFPELAAVKRIIDLSNPIRYAQLRDLGLSAKEAYLASSGTLRRASGKEHLKGSVVPKGAGVKDGSMSLSELKCARELFGSLSDDELQRLYAKVTK